jgi:hypothetical protein
VTSPEYPRTVASRLEARQKLADSYSFSHIEELVDPCEERFRLCEDAPPFLRVSLTQEPDDLQSKERAAVREHGVPFDTAVGRPHHLNEPLGDVGPEEMALADVGAYDDWAADRFDASRDRGMRVPFELSGVFHGRTSKKPQLDEPSHLPRRGQQSKSPLFPSVAQQRHPAHPGGWGFC